MQLDIFSEINQIIERESKSSTYKFALLRGVIDIIQDNSPYIAESVSTVQMPLGLLVEKWILYYYPLLEHPAGIRQSHGEGRMAFTEELQALISYYSSKGGLSAFYQDYRTGQLPVEVHAVLYSLYLKLRDTITRMPMKYLGTSVGKGGFYSIFKPVLEHRKRSHHRGPDQQHLIHGYGYFKMPITYFNVLQLMGSFISGRDSLLVKWAEFSVAASGGKLRMEQVLEEALKSPVTDRLVNESKKVYASVLEQCGTVHCVWTGKPVRQFDIDHAIPFSIWRNNDLWNLLPASKDANRKKSDSIPDPGLIERQQKLITKYWTMLRLAHTDRFDREIRVALLGEGKAEGWEQTAIRNLQQNCHYLIHQRGFAPWTI